MIHIITDSCADLSPALKERYHIHTVPLSVYLGGQTYLDGEEISLAELFAGVKQHNQLPKTSAVPQGRFEAAFQSLTGDLLVLTISSQLSATYQSAVLASRTYPDRTIRVIDTSNLSTGIGLLALRAAELRDAGKSLDEIAEDITQTAPRVRTAFIIDTLEYLYMGGRCSAMQNIMGSLLQIRPVIECRPDGTLGIQSRVRGTRKKALASLVESFRKNLEQMDLHRVFITHTGCDEDAQAVGAEMAALAPIQEICITYTGATVACHCGPNTLGIIYLEK